MKKMAAIFFTPLTTKISHIMTIYNLTYICILQLVNAVKEICSSIQCDAKANAFFLRLKRCFKTCGKSLPVLSNLECHRFEVHSKQSQDVFITIVFSAKQTQIFKNFHKEAPFHGQDAKNRLTWLKCSKVSSQECPLMQTTF